MSREETGAQIFSTRGRDTATPTGLLIVNADDWGRDAVTTDRTLECARRGAVSSVSGMVFMEDSERAAATAGDEGIEAGLHLNLTTPFPRHGARRPWSSANASWLGIFGDTDSAKSSSIPD